jgi:hypothetical protein
MAHLLTVKTSPSTDRIYRAFHRDLTVKIPHPNTHFLQNPLQKRTFHPCKKFG